MKRLGITIGLEQGSLSDAVELGRRAESLGYTDAWSAEVGGADGLSSLAALAAVTERIRLGTAILPVFTRPPALIAMGAATLQSLSQGRFVLGLGASSPIIVERWMGSPYERPLTRVREYVKVLRALLEGEKVTFEGRTVALSDFRLQLQPGAPVSIYVAGLGPAACRLAGEVGDGVVLFLKSPAGVRQALEWVEEGAAGAGRALERIECVARLPVMHGEPDPALARRLVVGYAIVDAYARSLAGQGFEAQVREISSSWGAGDRKGAAERVTDEMLDELLVLGDGVRCREGIDAFRKAGVTTPVLLPIVPPTEPNGGAGRLEEALTDLAPA